MTIHDWARRLLSGQPADDAPIHRVIVFQRGHYVLLPPDVVTKGARLVSVTRSQLDRYLLLQIEMSLLPTSLRPRKRRAKKAVEAGA